MGSDYDPSLLAEMDPSERALLLAKPQSLTEEQKYQRRKLQNRMASISSRAKKSKQLNSLEQTTQTLKDDLSESQLVNRILRIQVNELLTILSRVNAFENDSFNDPQATKCPQQIQYEINAPSTTNELISVVDFGIKTELLEGLRLFHPQQNGILSASAYFMDNGESDAYNENDIDQQLLNTSTRTTRRQAALLHKQQVKIPQIQVVTTQPQPQPTLVHEQQQQQQQQQEPSPTPVPTRRIKLVKQHSQQPSPTHYQQERLQSSSSSSSLSTPSSVEHSPIIAAMDGNKMNHHNIMFDGPSSNDMSPLPTPTQLTPSSSGEYANELILAPPLAVSLSVIDAAQQKQQHQDVQPATNSLFQQLPFNNNNNDNEEGQLQFSQQPMLPSFSSTFEPFGQILNNKNAVGFQDFPSLVHDKFSRLSSSSSSSASSSLTPVSLMQQSSFYTPQHISNSFDVHPLIFPASKNYEMISSSYTCPSSPMVSSSPVSLQTPSQKPIQFETLFSFGPQ